MKYTRIGCLLILLALVITPLMFNSIKGQDDDCPTGIDYYEYQGIIREQKFRKKLVPQFYDDPSNPLYDVFGGFKLRSFVFFFDSCDDIDNDINQIVCLYGINDLRNAPFYSLNFESTELGGVYGINLSKEIGVDWVTLSPDVMNKTLPAYDRFYSAIYTLIVNNTYLTHKELYHERPSLPPVTLSDIYEDWDSWGLFPELENIVLADLTARTGSVGVWQQINKDQTIIKGNFTTYGPTNPIFKNPQDVNNTDDWWPTYNISVAQNIERSSLPRTHSFEVNYSFVGVLSAFGVIFAVISIRLLSRRSKK